MKGFTFPLGRHDVFVCTTKINKTTYLASEILRKLELPDNPDTRKEVLWYLKRAECEIKTLSNGRKYYDIHGDQFGGYGAFFDAPENERTIVIQI